MNHSNTIFFSEGLPAFEDEKEFYLIPREEPVPIFYLQSASSDLCFVMSDPFLFFPDYEIDLPDALLASIGADEETSSLMVFTILTIGEKLQSTTANLLAPVIINARNRKGFQYIPEKTSYSTKHPLFAKVSDPTTAYDREGL